MEYLSELHQISVGVTNEMLAGFFKTAIAEGDKISSNYGRLWRHMETVVMHGGKRLRPYLTLVGYGQFDKNSVHEAVPFAAAQELLHTALLMHDDIIDRDDVRHGIDNLNGFYKREYTRLPEPDKTHFAHSAALLGGDLLIAGAHRLIIANTSKPDDQVAALAQLYQSIFEVAGGELMDVEASFSVDKQLHALPIAIHKTASYSFIGPLLTGARLAHAPEAHIKALHAFGLNLGIAYQLQDDLLGIFGDETITGKSTVNDIREAKQTYIIEQYLASTAADTQLFARTFGNKHASTSDISSLKASIEASGARKKTETAVQDYIQKSRSALDQLDPKHPTRDELSIFLENIINRNK